ncbi:uncharacterized protein LOC113229885 [Hyposmocoma kahamanoa]|uniref:uncharacterized protein LOC113228157 n=1 Tax=Hyposmocoma kahamanoa TaxID=1477025 RepID=UPI000E6D6186|nr:uncharacterized protein LOC113228157 [Hyposmocoma kahamanoa]XP_026317159.1 uncharacterized protein LOC113228157 [Hyposmocoma kahamanoa]XP_026319357.1 uncharacterized protein LOC113229885 [Hyposmocoma kahamanoa]XP_026319358.1 uncharacterized protein LOC113229885 [Hyposmocoma kahamanoa]
MEDDDSYESEYSSSMGQQSDCDGISSHEYYSDMDRQTVRSVIADANTHRYPTETTDLQVSTPQSCDKDPSASKGNDDAPSVTHTSNNTLENASCLSSDILAILGDSKAKEEKFGPKIRDEVSKRWGSILMDGLGKEQRQNLLESALIPENFQLLKAPKLNPEISAVLNESSRNRDKRLEKAQHHLGIGIAAVTNLMTTLIDGNAEKTEIIKRLSETGQLLLDLHYQNTINRRKLIMFCLDKKFINMVQNVKRDSYLFGDNLGEKIKATKIAERSGLQVKRKEPQPSTSYRTNKYTARQGNARSLSRQQSGRNRANGYRPPTSATTGRRPPPTPVDRYQPPSSRTGHKITQKS